MQDILVIRFSSLGDLCLLAGSLARLSSGPDAGNRRVTLVTKAAFAPLMRQAEGVDRVLPLADSNWRTLKLLAGELESVSWDRIIDAHNTLRSHLLLGMMGLRPDIRLAKDTAARLAFMQFGKGSKRLEHTMSDRFDDLFRDLTLSDDSGPRLNPESGDGACHAFPGKSESPETILGLAPGAQWDTKQWPERFFAEVLTRFRQKSSAPVRIFLGPREERWFPGSGLEKAVARLKGVQVFRGLPLVDIVGLIGDCSVLLTNDSGLLHLAEATGTPVLAIFGPTVREFGYFPHLATSRALESPLGCRPCSRNGKSPCHRDDLACLASITPDEVLETVLAATAWTQPEHRPSIGSANPKEES
ncbi:MAG: glycosyltransferase family 9 protein [Gemmatimonadales bacterium]|nr:glycosyltransferase family 9 protein [Gemmatimonadales bacterium]